MMNKRADNYLRKYFNPYQMDKTILRHLTKKILIFLFMSFIYRSNNWIIYQILKLFLWLTFILYPGMTSLSAYVGDLFLKDSKNT